MRACSSVDVPVVSARLIAVAFSRLLVACGSTEEAHDAEVLVRPRQHVQGLFVRRDHPRLHGARLPGAQHVHRG
jgi:hypothetical protein